MRTPRNWTASFVVLLLGLGLSAPTALAEDASSAPVISTTASAAAETAKSESAVSAAPSTTTTSAAPATESPPTSAATPKSVAPKVAAATADLSVNATATQTGDSLAMTSVTTSDGNTYPADVAANGEWVAVDKIPADFLVAGYTGCEFDLVVVLQDGTSRRFEKTVTVEGCGNATPTPEPTVTVTPTPSPSVSPTPTPTPTPTVTVTPTPEPTVTTTPTPSVTATPSATASPTSSVSPSPTSSATSTPTVSPTATATPTPSPSVSPTPTPTPTPKPSKGPKAKMVFKAHKSAAQLLKLLRKGGTKVYWWGSARGTTHHDRIFVTKRHYDALAVFGPWGVKVYVNVRKGARFTAPSGRWFDAVYLFDRHRLSLAAKRVG